MLTTRRSCLIHAAILLPIGTAWAGDCVQFSGREHCPRNDTTLQLNANGLLVTGTTSAIVEVDLSDDQSFGCTFDPIMFDMNRDSAANMAVVGVIDGNPDLTVGTMFPDYDFGTQTLEVFGSLVGVGDFVTVEVWNLGVRVDSIDVNDAAARISAITQAGIKSMAYSSVSGPQMRLSLTEAADWTLDTLAARGNEIRFVARNPDSVVDSLEWASVETIFIPSFQITREFTDAPTLELGGNCPGSVSISVQDATPRGTIALLYGFATGGTVVPFGPCVGTVIDLANPSVAAVIPLDHTGTFQFTTPVPPGACGNVIAQVLDLTTCLTSNLDAL